MKLSSSRMKSYLRGRRGRQAYTLLEIMIVLGIIAVLMGSAIYYLTGAVGGAKMQRVDGDISSITSALKMYEINNRFLPTTEQGLMALVKKPESEPVPKRWSQLMKDVPLDPWSHPYQYVYPGKHNPDGFDLYSLGPDGVESSDDVGNW
ncbi:MAG: type II secretion system major pseudopilin GspG [Methylacidiphilales bacterium]|nr:type II secretion system major pseudopilin GspG [Candidatus Methylacidiphilales bacterium]